VLRSVRTPEILGFKGIFHPQSGLWVTNLAWRPILMMIPQKSFRFAIISYYPEYRYPKSIVTTRISPVSRFVIARLYCSVMVGARRVPTKQALAYVKNERDKP
jgi:hypothetical protein